MAEVDQTNQAQPADQGQQQAQPGSQSVLDLIRVQDLGQLAQIQGIIAYEMAHAANGQFPLVFFPVINKFVRIGDEGEALPRNVVMLAGTAQYSSSSFSLLVKSARNLGRADFAAEFVVFRQASYSWPEHRVVPIDEFPIEKEAITYLLELYFEAEAEKLKAAGKPVDDVSDKFFGLFYLPQSLMEKNVNLESSPDAEFLNVPSLGVYKAPSAVPAGLPDDLLDMPPGRGESIDNI